MNIGLKAVWKFMPKELAEMRKEGGRNYYKMTKDTMQETLEVIRDPTTLEAIKREYTRPRYERLRQLVNNPEELLALAKTTSLKESLSETFPYVQALHKFHLILVEKFIFKDGDFREYVEREPVVYDLSNLMLANSCDFARRP